MVGYLIFNGGEGFSIDASLIKADVDKKKRLPGDQPIAWPKPEEASHAVREYLAALDTGRSDDENGSDDGGLSGGSKRSKPPKEVSLTDPQAAWVARKNTDPFFAYDANYLIDNKAGIIVDAEGHTRQSQSRDCHHRDNDRTCEGSLRTAAAAVGGRHCLRRGKVAQLVGGPSNPAAHPGLG
jgi:hypothetical protein